MTGLEPGRSRAWLFAAGLCLGAGFYSYIASMALMPIYCALTLASCLPRSGRARDPARRCRLRDSADRCLRFGSCSIPTCFGPRPNVTGLPDRRSEARPMDLAAIADR